MCLGLIYELLYGQVFGMEDIDTAIQVMLYEGKQTKESFEVFYFYRHLVISVDFCRFIFSAFDFVAEEGTDWSKQRHQHPRQGRYSFPLQSG